MRGVSITDTGRGGRSAEELRADVVLAHASSHFSASGEFDLSAESCGIFRGNLWTFLGDRRITGLKTDERELDASGRPFLCDKSGAMLGSREEASRCIRAAHSNIV